MPKSLRSKMASEMLGATTPARGVSTYNQAMKRRLAEAMAASRGHAMGLRMKLGCSDEIGDREDELTNTV